MPAPLAVHAHTSALPLLSEPTAHERRQIQARGFSDSDIRILFGRRQRVLSRLAIITGGTTSAVPDGSGALLGRGEAGYAEPDHSTGKGRALAASPGARPPRGGESQLPPGTHELDDMRVRREGPPSRDFDLLGHYVWKFERSRGDYYLTERLCAQAERDIERETGKSLNVNEDHRIRDARILQFHAGEKPWHVATFNDCTPEYVRRLRITEGLDPEEGMEIEVVDDESAQLVRVVALKAKGASLRVIAMELGTSKSTVHRMLTGQAA